MADTHYSPVDVERPELVQPELSLAVFELCEIVDEIDYLCSNCGTGSCGGSCVGATTTSSYSTCSGSYYECTGCTSCSCGGCML